MNPKDVAQKIADENAAPTTPDEQSAIDREVDWLLGHADDWESFKKRAADGPCFCAGDFTCTKHVIERDETS